MMAIYLRLYLKSLYIQVQNNDGYLYQLWYILLENIAYAHHRLDKKDNPYVKLPNDDTFYLLNFHL